VKRLQVIADALQSEAVWQQPAKLRSLQKEQALLQQTVSKLQALNAALDESEELLNLLLEETHEATINGFLSEVSTDVKRYESQIAQLEFQRKFSGDMDSNSAYLDIQSGSGGTEAQDWANMLLRMYLRWGERHNFKTTLLEVSAGEIAGIKSATIQFEGAYAYGWLRTETGIHRLVRKSPFNASGKRHTSFASVFVYPEVDDSIAIDISSADLKIDTYRASGAGGQHVNRTDSAVRITHQPTGIVVQCQNERSQHQNKANAMKQLRAKLYERELRARQATQQALEATKSDIGWGSQIRSYVLDESRIKDLRTGVESHNTKAVLDGDLDEFIEASLLL
jgi:peptide chain release factor 2